MSYLKVGGLNYNHIVTDSELPIADVDSFAEQCDAAQNSRYLTITIRRSVCESMVRQGNSIYIRDALPYLGYELLQGVTDFHRSINGGVESIVLTVIANMHQLQHPAPPIAPVAMVEDEPELATNAEDNTNLGSDVQDDPKYDAWEFI